MDLLVRAFLRREFTKMLLKIVQRNEESILNRIKLFIHILCLNCIAFESFLHNSYFCLSADIEWITFSLSFVGMTGSSMAVATLFLYSTELFPTVVRNSGLGIANLCACIGGIIAPYIPDLVLSLYMFLTSIVISYLPRCQLCVGCKIYNN